MVKLDANGKAPDLKRICSLGVVRVAGYSGSNLPKGTCSGKNERVVAEIKKLYGQMRDAAKVENYERAAELRYKIREMAQDLGKNF